MSHRDSVTRYSVTRVTACRPPQRFQTRGQTKVCDERSKCRWYVGICGELAPQASQIVAFRFTHWLLEARSSWQNTRLANAISRKVCTPPRTSTFRLLITICTLATQTILSKIPPNNSKLTYVWEQYLFHYISHGGFTYLVMAEDTAGRCVTEIILTECVIRS